MSGFLQISSINTRRFTSTSQSFAFHLSRPRFMSGRFFSAGTTIFSKGQIVTPQRLIDGRNAATEAQYRVVASIGGVGVLRDEFPQAIRVDLHVPRPAAGPWVRLAAQLHTLLYPPRPRLAHQEYLVDLVGLHAAFVRREHGLAEFLGVRFGYP
ncbi:MAG: hypothetical protein AAF710_00415 [Planctomycetota bacterium]